MGDILSALNDYGIHGVIHGVSFLAIGYLFRALQTSQSKRLEYMQEIRDSDRDLMLAQHQAIETLKQAIEFVRGVPR